MSDLAPPGSNDVSSAINEPDFTGQITPDTNPFLKALDAIPRILSSKLHVILLFGLGFYIVVLHLLGVSVSAKSELIGGNYENTTSDIGACIAAGGTVHLVKKNREHRRELDRLHDKIDTLIERDRPA